MIKIGITGSLASGKTTASKILSFRLGPLFNADKIVKEFYRNKHFKSLVSKRFKLKNNSQLKKSLKNLILKNKKNDFEKIDTEIIFSSIVEFSNESLTKEEMEKTILINIPSKIYPELRQIFIFLFENSGFKDIKINETVDFEKLYKMRKVQ